jgi:putative peptidoglycan lipid II flippase
MVSRLIKNSQQLLSRKQNSILSAATVLMVAVFFSRILGLLRDRFLAGTFFSPDTAWQLDVYFAAFRLPDMIFQLLVVGALSAAFIPVFTRFLVKDKQEAWQIASTVISIGLVIFILMGIALIFFALPLSKLIAPSFSAKEIDLMVKITRLLILAQGSFLVSNFITGILQSYQYFLIPALAPITYNLGIIFGILVLSPIFGIFGPVFGVIIGALLHLLIQLPLLRSLGFRYQFKLRLSHPGVRRIGRLMLPRTMALAVTQIELTVAVFIATSLSAGSLSIFYFAQHLNALPVGLFGSTIGQASLPSLSRSYHSSNKLKNFKTLLVSSLNQTLYLSLPASMILLILRIPAVRLAFGAGSFPWQATLLTGQVVALFAISVFAQSAIQILVRGFYALNNTKTPLILAVLAVILNVLLSFSLVYTFNLNILGLALAISISSFFHAGLLFFFLSKLVNGFAPKQLLIPFLKMSLATIVTGFALWIPLRVLDRFILNTAKTLQLIVLVIIVCLIGMSVYLLLSKLLKIKELDSFSRLFRRLSSLKHYIFKPPLVIDDSEASS